MRVSYKDLLGPRICELQESLKQKKNPSPWTKGGLQGLKIIRAEIEREESERFVGMYARNHWLIEVT